MLSYVVFAYSTKLLTHQRRRILQVYRSKSHTFYLWWLLNFDLWLYARPFQQNVQKMADGWLLFLYSGRGMEVITDSTGNDPCLSVRTWPFVEPLFCSVDGIPLATSHSVELVQWAGVPVAGHSFHIGTATAAAEARIPDPVIQVLGCWASPAFLCYVPTPWKQLAQHSSPLARRS